MQSDRRFQIMQSDSDFWVEIKTHKNFWVVAMLGVMILKGFSRTHRIAPYFQRVLSNPNPDTADVFVVGIICVAFLFSFSLTLTWFLWTFFGREIVGIRHDNLWIKYDIFGQGPIKTYRASKVSDIRPHHQRNPFRSILQRGNIAFDYDGKTHHFGLTLQKEDCEAISEELKAHLS